MTKPCSHFQLKVTYLSNEEGSVELQICKNKDCSKLVSFICEHKNNDWVYTRNQGNPEEKMLICRLCGADGT